VRSDVTSEPRVNSHAVMIAWHGMRSGVSFMQDGSDGTPILGRSPRKGGSFKGKRGA